MMVHCTAFMADSQIETIPDSFEEALSQLDSIVESLEGEGVALTELINQYDRGMQLLDACHTKLEDAKQRVETIGKAHGANATIEDDPNHDPENPAEDLNDELF